LNKVLIVYHFYYPDDVVSALEISDLSEGLVERGYEVEVWAGNRACHDSSITYGPALESIKGVKVRRFWRPAFNQHSFFGRILNSIWLQKVWFWKLLFTPSLKPDIILTGTDPLFLILATPFFKLIRLKAKMVHWAFDLYPEVAIADGILTENGLLDRMIRPFLRWAYGKCDLIADLGPCMRDRLSRYPGGKRVTLTPWALEEPAAPLIPDPAERALVFGPNNGMGSGMKNEKHNMAPLLCLMYSGSFGRAHEYELTLKLARLLEDRGVVSYSARGSRLGDLKREVTPNDTNVRFVDFAPPDRLSARLSAPDIHIVSLRPQWSGTVVPSKFFGALAAGRPVLFEGSNECSIARWITEYKVGWHLRADSLDSIASELEAFGKNEARKQTMFKHCNEIYHMHFSKKTVMDKWDRALKVILGMSEK